MYMPNSFIFLIFATNNEKNCNFTIYILLNYARQEIINRIYFVGISIRIYA